MEVKPQQSLSKIESPKPLLLQYLAHKIQLDVNELAWQEKKTPPQKMLSTIYSSTELWNRNNGKASLFLYIELITTMFITTMQSLKFNKKGEFITRLQSLKQV